MFSGILAWFITSRTGVAILASAGVFLGFMTWHWADKSAAVKNAREGYVKLVELEAAKSELSEARRRAVVAEQANITLQHEVDVAEVKKINFERELQEYADKNPIDPDCRVTGDFLDGLQ